MMPKPICVKCQLFYKPAKNGVAWEEGRPLVLEDGTETWVEYKLWEGDLLQCAGCGDQIITGHGQVPLGEHYEPRYEAKVLAFQPIFRVDDC